MTDSDDVRDTGVLRGSLSRYDLLLASIPLAFGSALVAGAVLAVPPRAALTAASLVGMLAVADGLFRHPPRPASGTGPGR